MRAAWMLVFLTLPGCYDFDFEKAIGETGGPDCETTIEGSEEVADAIAEPTSADVQEIWDASCSGSSCHTGGGQAGGIALDDGYAATVDAPSGKGDLDYVEPGDPCASYLYHKLAGSQLEVGGTGGQMPLGGELTEAELATVTNWIKNNAAE